jgi:hypothetical protein
VFVLGPLAIDSQDAAAQSNGVVIGFTTWRCIPLAGLLVTGGGALDAVGWATPNSGSGSVPTDFGSPRSILELLRLDRGPCRLESQSGFI